MPNPNGNPDFPRGPLPNWKLNLKLRYQQNRVLRSAIVDSALHVRSLSLPPDKEIPLLCQLTESWCSLVRANKIKSEPNQKKSPKPSHQAKNVPVLLNRMLAARPQSPASITLKHPQTSPH